MHNFALAFDVVPLDAGKPVWNVSNSVWQRVGIAGKACGLEWAGDWKQFREVAHFQYTGGLSLAEMREGKRPATLRPATLRPGISNHKPEGPLNAVPVQGRQGYPFQPRRRRPPQSVIMTSRADSIYCQDITGWRICGIPFGCVRSTSPFLTSIHDHFLRPSARYLS